MYELYFSITAVVRLEDNPLMNPYRFKMYSIMTAQTIGDIGGIEIVNGTSAVGSIVQNDRTPMPHLLIWCIGSNDITLALVPL